jgi:hypothetical protein
MTAEQLIEKARKAHRQTPGSDDDKMRAALAVFEEAHTPTNDEREAQYLCDTCGEYVPCSCATDREVGSDREDIWDAFDEMHRITEGGCDTRGKDVADMVLRLGFRRSEEPEATTNRGDIARRVMDHRYAGLCPDAVEGWDRRDPDCSACSALDALGAEEPEWAEDFIQYGHVLGIDESGVFIVEPRGKNYSTHQRRVKLGRPESSWVPVKQEEA